MRSLVYKLTLAFLLVGLIGVGLVAVLIAANTTREFHSFVDAQERQDLLARWTQYYVLHGSWEGTGEALPFIMPYSDPPAVERTSERRPSPNPRPAPIYPLVVDAQGRAVFSAAGYEAGQAVPASVTRDGLPIEVQGDTVGTLVLFDQQWPGAVPRTSFLTRFWRVLYWGAAGAVLLALALGVLFSRRLTRSLRELTVAAESMARGELQHSIPVRSNDEVGELTQAFNHMSADLTRAQQLRRQMTADVAHELRTPLSLVLGHAEALRDGVIPPSQENFAVIHDEAQRLARLVADLRTLSLSDAGELPLDLQPVAAGALLAQTAAAFAAPAQAQQVTLRTEAGTDLPDVLADSDRISQVLANLVSNALRYTPAGAEIVLSAARQDAAVRFAVADSGPGIAPEDLPFVFERFYRSDKSRQRERDSTGLGLAIARSIVEGHGGRLEARSTPGQGATFSFDLPLAPTST